MKKDKDSVEWRKLDNPKGLSQLKEILVQIRGTLEERREECVKKAEALAKLAEIRHKDITNTKGK